MYIFFILFLEIFGFFALIVIFGMVASLPILSWLVFGILGAFIAESRGYKSYESLAIGLLLGWFAPLIAFAKPVRKKCRHCQKWIELNVDLCPFCNKTQLLKPIKWLKNKLFSR